MCATAGYCMHVCDWEFGGSVSVSEVSMLICAREECLKNAHVKDTERSERYGTAAFT